MPRRSKAEHPADHTALEARLSYTFRDPALLTLALTHRSHVYEAAGHTDTATRNRPGTDNEQLEFLGDAVIGLIVAELLLDQFPACDEGELTRIRAALVSRQRMAALGAELHLADHLLLGQSADQSGARRRPALLANAAEAVLAALYLDASRAGENPLVPLRALAQRLLLAPELDNIRAALATSTTRGALRDAKTVLQERVQAINAGKLRYIDIDQTGPAHDRRFSVEARLETPTGTRTLAAAEGTSKREAQQRAAALALETWSSEPHSAESKPEAHA
jgi:ribonuclease-3